LFYIQNLVSLLEATQIQNITSLQTDWIAVNKPNFRDLEYQLTIQKRNIRDKD
jgi:hypothetical protein